MRLHHILLIIGICLFSFSCYDDYEIIDKTVIQQEEDTFYDGELVGKVIDESGDPLEEMEIVYAGDMHSTGKKGLFHFDAKKILHQGELLTLNTTSGFTYLHTTFPSRDDIHYSIANCYTVRSKALITSSNFNVSLNNDFNLSSSTTDFLLDNIIYTDDISIEGYYINLHADENLMFFPDALTSEIETSYLNKLEGIHFQWTSTDGQRLKVANGQVVTIQIPTINNIADVFVWHFNPNTSLWEKQSPPAIENGNYKFSVSTDGYYCIGTSNKAAHIDGHLIAQANAVPNAQIEIRDNEGNLINRTYSSETGAWHAVIPSDDNHTISVVSFCGDELTKLAMDQLNTSGDDVIISIDNLPVFTGAIKTCDNQLIEGSILFTDEGHYLYLKDGQLNAALPICNQSSIRLSACSITSQSESAILNWRPLPQNNIQSLFICDVPKDNYIALRADGAMRYYEITTSSIGLDGRINLTAFDSNDPDFIFNLKIPHQNPGVVSTDSLNITFNDSNLGNDGYTSACVSTNADCGFDQFDINHVGADAGDWICGSFTAKFWMRTTNLSPNLAYNNRTIEGEFRIKRNF